MLATVDQKQRLSFWLRGGCATGKTEEDREFPTAGSGFDRFAKHEREEQGPASSGFVVDVISQRRIDLRHDVHADKLVKFGCLSLKDVMVDGRDVWLIARPKLAHFDFITVCGVRCALSG
jgi:hypothetical protein